MDHEHFNQMYRNYTHQVFRFLLSLCGDYHLAEDLTQETFVKAYQSADEFRGDCRLSVWLCQIGKNLYFNYIKKQGHCIPTVEIPDTPDQKTVEDAAIDTATAYEIMEAVSQLPEPYQTVFLYRVFSQLSYKEIGDILLQSDVWARVTYYRAKKRLQTSLKEENDYEM